MSEKIGSAAGKIWKYLDKHQTASVAKLTDATNLSKNDIQRALGWLAREDKIIIEQKGRTETVSLK